MLSKAIMLCLLSAPLQAQVNPVWEFPNFSDRIHLTVENPRDTTYDGVAIMKLADLRGRGATFPGTLLLAADDSTPARTLVTQLDQDELSVEVHLPPHATKSLSLYYSATLHDALPVIPQVHASHNYGYNHATAAIESERMGYRTYGGFFLDVQAHAKGERGLFNAMLGYASISHPPVEGQDVIHLGDTLGLGGIFLRTGGTVYRPPFSTPDYTHRPAKPGEPTYRVVSDGPIRAAIEENVADWVIGTDHVALRAVYEMDADQEVVHCHWWLTPLKLSQSYEVGAGIRRLPHGHVTEGVEAVTTDGLQETAVGRIALGLAFDKQTKRGASLTTKEGGNEVVLFPEQLTADHAIEGTYTVAAAWQGSGWGDPAAHVREVLQSQSHAVRTTLGAHETNANAKTLEAEPK